MIKKLKSITTILWPMVVIVGVLMGSASTEAKAQSLSRLNIPQAGTSPAPTAMTPSMAVDPYGAGGSGSTYGAGTTYGTVPGTAPSSYGSYGASTTPYNNVAPASPYGNITSPYPNAGTMSSVPVTPGNVAGPIPTFQGGSAAPPPGWDPYASPGTTTNPGLLPADYYPTVPTLDLNAANQWRQKFMQELRLDYYFFPARGSKRFGTNDLDLSATFAFPFLYNPETPILVTPGFAFHWWEGPIGNDLPACFDNLPPRVYDSYLDTAWNPKLPNTPISGELAFRIGVYSDFEKLTMESLRYTGHGFMVVTLRPEPNPVKAKLGIVYYDRVKIKMLPAGGLVWHIGDNYRFDILFPNPMFARRMSTTMWNMDLWLYLRGEYGGGSWVLTPSTPSAPTRQYDYNDMRAALGIEFANKDERRASALVEVGISFERELVCDTDPGQEEFNPSTTIFLRAGAVY